MHVQYGNMTQQQWETLEYFLLSYLPLPTHIFYVYVDAETAYKRIRDRNRREERGITFHYLTDFEKAQERWLEECQIPVIRIDGTQSPEKVEQEVLHALTTLDMSLLHASE